MTTVLSEVSKSTQPPASVLMAPAVVPAINLTDPSLLINRELSWLEFNRRVLQEAEDERHPLLERVKFLAIFSTNLDEFFMIRVAGLKQQVKAGVIDRTPDGMTPAEQLAAIHLQTLQLLDEQRHLLSKQMLPQLAAQGIYLLNWSDLTEAQRLHLRSYYEREIFPVLTPLAVDPGHPFPHISNLSLNLAVSLRDMVDGDLFARLKVPKTLDRFIPVDPGPRQVPGVGGHAPVCLVWLEQVIANNLDALFPGMEIVESYPFRVTRNADIEIEEDEADDLLESIEERLQQRQFGLVVRLTVENDIPDNVKTLLAEHLKLSPQDVYTLSGPLGLGDLMALHKLNRPDLKDAPFIPCSPVGVRSGEDIFSAIVRNDILVHHPYDSFHPVVDFIRAAATDPHVLAIKQTLYRVGTDSPIVDALLEARENDKQVAVLVELKARFDEENNIEWARALERAGVHVVYGLIGLKTHCKIALVIRKETDGIRRYVHLGTGNYNASTARVYTDLGLLTCRPEIGADASELFNSLTGYSNQKEYRKLLVAPANLRRRLIGLIEREIGHAIAGRGGRLIFKMNALVDPQTIMALYKAAQAGVDIDLIVRGICCLRPGIPGVSEKIRVRSLVGRFLEHSRIYYFGNGGHDEVYIGSADLMQRNLDRRVECCFPIDDPSHKTYLRDVVLQSYLRDTVNARILLPDGCYQDVQPAPGERPFDAQTFLLP